MIAEQSTGAGRESVVLGFIPHPPTLRVAANRSREKHYEEKQHT
jgi:hypothetical protein